MSSGSTFEEYLVSKKIDTQRFRDAEPEVWTAWKSEFEQMHPNSFTLQKLNLINPVRRKYQLRPGNDDKGPSGSPAPTPAATTSPKPGKPIIKPRTV